MPKSPNRVARGRPPLGPQARATERRRIGALAEGLFREEGFESVSLRRLAAVAGCTPMTLYAYFDNKADILREIWSRMLQELFAELEGQAAAQTDPRQLLLTLSHHYVRYWLDHPDRSRMIFMTPGVTQGDVGVFVGDGQSTRRFALFSDAIARSIADPEPARVKLVGETLVCGLHGIAHNHITISRYPWENASGHVETLVRALTR